MFIDRYGTPSVKLFRPILERAGLFEEYGRIKARLRWEGVRAWNAVVLALTELLPKLGDVNQYIDEPTPAVGSYAAPKGANKASAKLSHDAIQWVFDHMADPEATPEEAPCSGAWYMLENCRTDQYAKNAFYSTTYPKLLPSKPELDKESARDSDDADLTDLLDRVEEANAQCGN